MKKYNVIFFIAKMFPFLGNFKRFAKALFLKLRSLKNSYAQNGEDILLLNLISQYDKDFSVDYIDVGANHPSDISNTYLLYRKKYNGFLIEPNPELCNLLRTFRSKDIVLNLGISNETSVLPFYISKTPVRSSFDYSYFEKNQGMLDKVIYIPIMKIDEIFKEMNIESIGILSIDVEGWNRIAIKSAKNILKMVHIVCLEYDNSIEKEEMINFLNDFSLIEDNGCNLIFARI